MNCIQASRIKGGSVFSTFIANFSTGVANVAGFSELKTNTSYRETCRAQDGNLESDYAIRNLPCAEKHIYRGSIYRGLYDFGEIGMFGRCRFLDTPGYISPYVFRAYISMDLFGGPLPYFNTRLNAYGRKAKAYYENPVNAPKLHYASPSNSILILNAWDPETRTGFAPDSNQATITWSGLSYAVGNNIERDLNGNVRIREWITSEEEPYWSITDHPFTGTGKRTFSDLENYGD
jgi:hypothetical protein